MTKKYSKSTKADPVRNPYVVPARFRSGSGTHKDKRKENNKFACRDKTLD